MTPFENSAIVMAHPDDEVLWASSAMRAAAQIILCYERTLSFPAWEEGRRRSLAEFPLPTAINLGLTESEAFNSADWPDPVPADYGLAIRQHPDSMANYSEARYRENFATLTATLPPLLKGRRNVITHNPWGEYGHEEHVQVFRAVAALRAELGYTVWVTGYASEKTWSAMRSLLPTLDCGGPGYPTDPALGEELKAIYRRNGCWTWFDDYRWPARETFHRLLDAGEAPVPLPPGSLVNLLWIDWHPRKAPPSTLRRIARRGKRMLGRG